MPNAQGAFPAKTLRARLKAPCLAEGNFLKAHGTIMHLNNKRMWLSYPNSPITSSCLSGTIIVAILSQCPDTLNTIKTTRTRKHSSTFYVTLISIDTLKSARLRLPDSTTDYGVLYTIMNTKVHRTDILSLNAILPLALVMSFYLYE